LNGEGISDEEYAHAPKVWKTFDMKTFRDYHDFYNAADVLQLADIFESFQDVCMKNYKLDPSMVLYYARSSMNACLKLTKVL
jgi:hypothetical protein